MHYFISDPFDPSTSLSDVPVGTIIPWVPEANLLAGSCLYEHSTQNTLPDGWVHCDGSVIPEPSPWHGTTTPNLNEEQCFLFPPGNKNPQDLITKHMQTDNVKNKAANTTSTSKGDSVNLSSKILKVFWIMRIW